MTFRAPLIAMISVLMLVPLASQARTQDGSSLSTQGTEISADEIAEAKIVYPEILSDDPWSFGGTPGRVIRTAHYRIYTTETTPVIRERLAKFAEYALPHYRTSLSPNNPLPRPTQRLDTYLMDNRPQWTTITKRLAGQRSDELLKIGRGGFAFGGIGVYYDLGLYDTLAIAAHEGWHQYTQRTFKVSLPIWLEEGIAAYNEGHRWDRSTPVFRPWANPQRYERLVIAEREGSLFSIEKLLESAPQDYFDSTDGSVLTYYAQLWALVHFLNEGENGKYQASLRILLQDAASGKAMETLEKRLGTENARRTLLSRSGPAIFFAYFDEDLDRVNEEYMAFIKEITAQSVRSQIVNGTSPFAP